MRQETQGVVERIAANDPSITAISISNKGLQMHADRILYGIDVRPETQRIFERIAANDPSITAISISDEGLQINPDRINHDMIVINGGLQINPNRILYGIDSARPIYGHWLADALKTNRSATYLSVKNYSIYEEGATALANMLKTNNTLTTLDISIGDIGFKGAIALADALKTNTTLSHLNIKGGIGGKGIEALMNTLDTNTTLTDLTLYDSGPIGIKGAKALDRILRINTNLTVLHLTYGNIGVANRQFLNNALEHNWALIHSFHAETSRRNYFFAKKLAALCNNLFAQQKQAELNDPDSKATIFSKKLSESSQAMHSLAYKLPITFWDFQKLNHGGYAALKLKLTEYPNNLTRQEANFVVERLKALEPHIYVRDVVLADQDEHNTKLNYALIFGRNLSTINSTAFSTFKTPEVLRGLTNQALRDWSLEEIVSNEVSFSNVLGENGLNDPVIQQISGALSLEVKLNLLENQRALGWFLECVEKDQSASPDFTSLATTALLSKDKKLVISIPKNAIKHGADEVLGSDLKRSRIHEPAQSSDHSRS